MKKSPTRNLLGSTAAALVAGLALPTGAMAQQATCSSPTTTTITCVDGTTTVATGTKDAATVVTAGPGLRTTSAGNQTTTLTATAPFTTTAASTNAVNLTSSGNLTFTGSGAISGTGTGSTGIVASATGGPLVVNIAAGSVIQGTTRGINLTSGATSTTTLNLNGTVQNVNGTGSALLVSGGAATINIGTTGRINGFSALTGGNDVINNAGFYDVRGTTNFGTGTDIFNNLASGTVASTTAGGTFSNLESFNNAGLITMVDGVAGDSLTLITPGSALPTYVGSGGARLAIDIEADTSAISTGGLLADSLSIFDFSSPTFFGSAAGSTVIVPNFVPGAIALDGDGVQVVTGNVASANTFTLGGPTSFGLIDFSLETRPGAGVFLVSRPKAAIFDIIALNNVAQDLWFQSADAFGRAATAVRNGLGTESDRQIGLWGVAYGGTDRYGDKAVEGLARGALLTYNARLETDRRGAQVGIDFRARDNVAVGLTGGYQRAEADMATGSELRAEGFNVGAYVYGMAKNGVFAGLLVKHDRNELEIGNGVIIDQVRPDSQTTGFEGEVGYRTASFGPIFEVAGAFAYTRTKTDDFETGFIGFKNDTLAHVRGRFGARLSWSGSLAPFIDAKVLHEGRRDTEVRIVSGGGPSTAFAGTGRGTWGRLEAGLAGGTQGGPMLSAWVEQGDVKGWGVAGGFRF